MKKSFLKDVNNFLKTPDWMLSRRAFTFLLSMPIVYIFGIIFFINNSTKKVQMLENEVAYIETLAKKCLPKEKSAVLTTIDPDYVMNVLGKMKFLSNDRKSLALLCTEVSHKDLYLGIKERLSFLEGEENQLNFIATDIEGRTIWTIKGRVEMSCKDIKKLISHVEGIPMEPFFPNPNRPDLFFSKIDLKRVNADYTDMYSVDIEIIQKRTT